MWPTLKPERAFNKFPRRNHRDKPPPITIFSSALLKNLAFRGTAGKLPFPRFVVTLNRERVYNLPRGSHEKGVCQSHSHLGSRENMIRSGALTWGRLLRPVNQDQQFYQYTAHQDKKAVRVWCLFLFSYHLINKRKITTIMSQEAGSAAQGAAGRKAILALLKALLRDRLQGPDLIICKNMPFGARHGLSNILAWSELFRQYFRTWERAVPFVLGLV